MSISIADFKFLQQEVLRLKHENYDLQTQFQLKQNNTRDDEPNAARDSDDNNPYLTKIQRQQSELEKLREICESQDDKIRVLRLENELTQAKDRIRARG